VVENCGATGNSDIRKIVIATGEVSTLAGSATSSGSVDGSGTDALFKCPWGITTDGSSLFVTDFGNQTIRKITPSSGTLSAMTRATAVVSTLAGAVGVIGAADGTGTLAKFNYPAGISTDGSSLYVADGRNYKIRKITPSSGTLSAMTSANAAVTSVTGMADTESLTGAADGTGSTAAFGYASDITTDRSSLYVVDNGNNKIRKITPSNGTLSAMTNATAVVSSITGVADTPVIAGAVDGTAATASFSSPFDITTDGSHLYVADNSNNKIRMITPTSGTLSTMTSATAVVSSITGAADTAVTTGATDGAAASASFYSPYGITTDGSSLYLSDEGNNVIRKIH
jgi:hydroxyethylthiazole kinase-like sugar kinase family protein